MTAVLTHDHIDALGPRAAVEALRALLATGFDPDAAPPRVFVDLDHGQGLLMPAEAGGWYGVKAVTIAPANPSRGLARINGLYLLHDSATLRPVAILDGVALTTLRTAAVSVAGVRDVLVERFAAGGARLLVFGSGPQAQAHVDAVAAHVPLTALTVVARSAQSAARVDGRGVPTLRLTPEQVTREVVGSADVLVAATTSREPVVRGAWVGEQAIAMAVGSHEPDVRELDADLLGRASVIVESRATALRECGDVIMAIDEGRLEPERLVTLAEVVAGHAPGPGPVVLKSAGMAWEDLAVAAAAYERWKTHE